MVLIHGTGGSVSWWDPVLPALADFYVVRVDLLGHGRSAKPDSGYGMAEQGHRVGAVLDRLGVRHAIVVGHSIGGYVATELAAQRSDLVSAIGVIGTGSRLDAFTDNGTLGNLRRRRPSNCPQSSMGRESRRAHQRGSVRDRGFQDTKLTDEAEAGMFHHRRPQRIPQRGSRFGEAATDHHTVDIEHRGGRRNGLSQSCPRTRQRGRRDGVTRSGGARQFHPGRSRPALSTRPPDRGHATRDGLHTSHTAAGTRHIPARYHDVADVAGIPGAAHENSAVADDAAADSGGDRHRQSGTDTA
ncbi:hypothetical protein C5E45_31860 [Nocardia nova]|uniref:AB hydrolase-1 domain-containing protein n=1 Tax=Nocardia nova TaxID=37330 RepID=A0A2S6AG69_9NOCA|nr:alpha/beta hydrolase [Nocardia nova]PPJ22768.1 hypothetical protein C5E41_26340 [Nocardia nova]PPJ33421.1 hypothetical protein C5E45_31860 [Nocardia nova]